jgi:hypothetical protein
MRLPLRFADWSLRVKMAGLLVAASIVPLAIAAFIDIRAARRQAIESAEALLAARADQLVGQMDSFHRGYQLVVEKLSRVPDAIAFCESPADAEGLRPVIQGILDVQPSVDPQVRGAALLDSSGIVRLGTEPALLGRDLSFRRYFRDGLRGAPVGGGATFYFSFSTRVSGGAR